jgi:RsiW-degrading membrane proteinase PrsW (M82 family)
MVHIDKSAAKWVSFTAGLALGAVALFWAALVVAFRTTPLEVLVAFSPLIAAVLVFRALDRYGPTAWRDTAALATLGAVMAVGLAAVLNTASEVVVRAVISRPGAARYLLLLVLAVAFEETLKFVCVLWGMRFVSRRHAPTYLAFFSALVVGTAFGACENLLWFHRDGFTWHNAAIRLPTGVFHASFTIAAATVYAGAQGAGLKRKLAIGAVGLTGATVLHAFWNLTWTAFSASGKEFPLAGNVVMGAVLLCMFALAAAGPAAQAWAALSGAVNSGLLSPEVRRLAVLPWGRSVMRRRHGRVGVEYLGAVEQLAFGGPSPGLEDRCRRLREEMEGAA